MKRRTIVLSSLAYCLTGAATGPGDADAEKPRVSPLAGVVGLERPVAYTEAKIPLGELLQKVAGDTGVALGAAPDAADEPVAVAVSGLAASDLLEQLAELLDYRWSRRKAGGAWRYEMWQDLAGKRREEALRQAGRADVQRRFREEVARFAEAANLPDEQFQAIAAAAGGAAAGLAGPVAEQAAEAGRLGRADDGRWRFRVVGQLWSPINRELARIAGSLGPREWATLEAGAPVVYSTAPQPGQLPLPDETAQIFRASQPTLFPPWSRPAPGDGGAGDHWARTEEYAQRVWREATGYEVRLSIEANRLSGWGSLALTLSAGALRAGGPAGAFVPGLSGDTTMRIGAGPLYPGPPLGEAPQEQGASLARDPVLGASKSFPAAGGRGDVESERGRTGPDPSDLLPELARVYGIQVISDAYWGSYPTLRGPEPAAGEPVALFSLLERIPTHRWDHRGRTVRLRSRTWFLDRPREVPLRLVRRWEGLCARLGALPLPEYLQMVSTLTQGQVEGLAAVRAGPGLRIDLIGLTSVPDAQYALRLYASLTAAQQLKLWHGGSVAAAQMTPTQRALFATAFQVRARHLEAPLDVRRLLSGVFSMTAKRFLLLTREGARISMEPDTVAQPAVDTAAPRSSTHSGQSRHQRESPAAQSATAGGDRRFPLVQIWFRFDCGAGLQTGAPPISAAAEVSPGVAPE